MADDTKSRGPQDRSRISLSQDHEIRYWTEKFGVSVEPLRAVQKAGPSTDAVAKELGKG